MGTLARAIAAERWDLAALCLLVGVTEAAESLPPGAADELIELLAEPPRRRVRGPDGPDAGARRHSGRSGRRGRKQ